MKIKFTMIVLTLPLALLIPGASFAEYNLAYSAPDCDYCNLQSPRAKSTYYHSKKINHSHNKKVNSKKPNVSPRSRSHYHLSVNYYHYSFTPLCDDHQCEYAYRPCQKTIHQSDSKRRLAHSYVTFSGEPTSLKGARFYSNEETEPSFYQDRATTDDDANAFPDMNIDH